MLRAPLFARVVGHALLWAAALMAQGSWCYQCHDEAEDLCKEGKCQVVEYETWVDHEAFQHPPAVDFGGGD